MVYKEAVRLVVPRAALLVALDRPNLTRDFAFGHADLNGEASRHDLVPGRIGSQSDVRARAARRVLARTQMLVPVDAVDRVLRTL